MNDKRRAAAARLLMIVSAKREAAERRFAAANNEIRATKVLIDQFRSRLAETPLAAGDAAYAAFAEGRRASLRREISALHVCLKTLGAESAERQREVERLLRQEMSLKSLIEAAETARRRSLARAG